MKLQQIKLDVLIIGSGAAGLSAALKLPQSRQIGIISKGPLCDGSTYYAQGGISAVLDPTDSISSHVEDTINAGAGLCKKDRVHAICSHGAEEIQWLMDVGVDFTHSDNNQAASPYHLTTEGGHSHRRVVHADDATGKALARSLIQAVKRAPNITIFENHIAVDLITDTLTSGAQGQIQGAYILDRKNESVRVFCARAIILATGGASKVYLYTSNPDVSTGDGIAMAWRAGCQVGNMEFIQFHPTCLYHPKAKSFLISEAVRGEGGKLLLPDGTRFMESVHAQAELAPRDIVARAIDHEMKRLGIDSVYLDISFMDAQFIKSRFPNIYQRCLRFGFDMTKEPLPVVPAAHYTCGGIVTDEYARTDIKGLYAIGECACTGMHGANRMASNSLLECLVMASAAAEDIDQQFKHPIAHSNTLPDWDESRVTDSDEEVVVSHNWDELRRFMWDYVGIVRTSKRLERAMRRVNLLEREINEYYSNFRVTNDLIELRNLVQVAELIIRSAMSRHESRGLHYTLDYPHTDHTRIPRDTLLTPPNHPSLQSPLQSFPATKVES